MKILRYAIVFILLLGGCGKAPEPEQPAVDPEAGRQIVEAECSGCHGMDGAGKRANILRALFSGEEEGTYFPAREDTLSRRKHWIAYTVKASGTLALDEGAVRAILEQGKSLLPKGVTAVDGAFDRGDAVALVDGQGKRVAKGLALYNAEETRAIAGLASWEIVDRLGYKYYDEVVHRDDLVVLEP